MTQESTKAATTAKQRKEKRATMNQMEYLNMVKKMQEEERKRLGGGNDDNNGVKHLSYGDLQHIEQHDQRVLQQKQMNYDRGGGGERVHTCVQCVCPAHHHHPQPRSYNKNDKDVDIIKIKYRRGRENTAVSHAQPTLVRINDHGKQGKVRYREGVGVGAGGTSALPSKFKQEEFIRNRKNQMNIQNGGQSGGQKIYIRNDDKSDGGVRPPSRGKGDGYLRPPPDRERPSSAPPPRTGRVVSPSPHLMPEPILKKPKEHRTMRSNKSLADPNAQNRGGTDFQPPPRMVRRNSEVITRPLSRKPNNNKTHFASDQDQQMYYYQQQDSRATTPTPKNTRRGRTLSQENIVDFGTYISSKINEWKLKRASKALHSELHTSKQLDNNVQLQVIKKLRSPKSTTVVRGEKSSKRSSLKGSILKDSGKMKKKGGSKDDVDVGDETSESYKKMNPLYNNPGVVADDEMCTNSSSNNNNNDDGNTGGLPQYQNSEFLY